MEQISIGDNLIRLRQQKKMTQEEVASFVGVTKASVSKWENKQSLPDIMILPRLASLFDITVDELLGYSMVLSREQIRKIYRDFTSDFASKPFDEVFGCVKDTVKKYYSCYQLLKYVCILLINHYNLNENEEKQKEVLLYIKKITKHIINDCKDSLIVDDVRSIEAMVDLLCKEYDEAIELIKDSVNPFRYAHGNMSLLIQAYFSKQDMDNAEKYAMYDIYDNILKVIGSSLLMMNIKIGDIDFCKKTIDRLNNLIDTYNIREVNKNIAAQVYYQAAFVYAMCGDADNTLYYLEVFVDVFLQMLKAPNEIISNEDDYFTRISEWQKESDLGDILPRNMKIVSMDIVQVLNNPVFTCVKEQKRYQTLIDKVSKSQ